MEYKVHVFAVVRIPVTVTADCQIDALRKADLEMDDKFTATGELQHDKDYYYLVDEEGDEYYERSRWYNSNHSPMIFRLSK